MGDGARDISDYEPMGVTQSNVENWFQITNAILEEKIPRNKVAKWMRFLMPSIYSRRIAGAGVAGLR